jgi:hypothetical protein
MNCWLENIELPRQWAYAGKLNADEVAIESLVSGSGNHSWERIEDQSSGRVVALRLQENSVGEVFIDSLIFIGGNGGPITGAMLRSLPLAAIEGAISAQRFAPIAQELPHSIASTFNVHAPLGKPRGDTYFHIKVALQFLEMKQGFKNPVAEMVKINGVAATTVQGWVTAARAKGLLAPGRPGIAG